MKLLGILVLCSVACLAMVVYAPASNDTMAKYFKDNTGKVESKVLELEQTLRAVDVPDQPQVEQYLVMAAWEVYYAMNAYMSEKDELAESIQALVDSGYLKSIPPNPLANWESMKFVSPDDEFQAGELVLQVAPPNYYSIVGSVESYQLKPMSFELGVYGLDKAVTSPSAKPAKHNSWATVPRGVLVMIGTARATADETLTAMRRSAVAKQNVEPK